MPKSKLDDLIKSEGTEDTTILKSEEPEEELWDADEWARENALHVPEDIKKKNPGSRFRWLDPDTISKKGWRKWAAVSSDEEEHTFSDTHGRSNDTLVRRGQLFLAKMPERLARAREAWHAKQNNREELATEAREKLKEELERRGGSLIGPGVTHGQRKKRGSRFFDMGRKK